MRRTLEEFHAFANMTHAIIWQGVAAVMRARISVAESRRLCEETRELLADLTASGDATRAARHSHAPVSGPR